MLRAPLLALLIAVLPALSSLRAADKPAKGPSTKVPTVEEQAAKLREDFRSTDPAVRLSAVSSMPHSPAASLLIPELFGALKDPDGGVREWAATVIGNQGEKAV